MKEAITLSTQALFVLDRESLSCERHVTVVASEALPMPILVLVGDS
jgi:hypothetical protein